MWSPSLAKIILVILLCSLGSPKEAQALPAVWNAPRENPHFIGRRTIFKKVSTIFGKSSIKIAVLAGPPGFGKSQIATQYIHQNYLNYQVVWWFQANQYMESQFRDFAEALDAAFDLKLGASLHTMEIKRLAMIVNNAIRKNNLRCLLVFDDLNYFAEIKEYIPHSHKKSVHVLITSQNDNFSTNKIFIRAFNSQESCEYIGKALPQETQETKQSLSRHAYHHPSILKFAVDYIRNYPGMTIKKYIETQALEADYKPFKQDFQDDYQISLIAAIQLNLNKLRSESQEAYQLLGFSTHLNYDKIQVSLLNKWLKVKFPQKGIINLIGYIKKYSFFDGEAREDNSEGYISMHELVQKITNSLISSQEKKKLIDEAVNLLEEDFDDRTDIVVEKISRNNLPFLNAERVLEVASSIDYRNSKIASLRNRVFDVVLCGFRDFKKAQKILKELNKDFKKNIQLSQKDYILHLISLSFFAGIYKPDNKKAIEYGAKALSLFNSQPSMNEEKIRLIANLIQFNTFIGNLKTCETLYQQGLKILPLSKSSSYNALFIFATSLYLLDLGKIEETIKNILASQKVLNDLDNYPSIRFYILNELARAYIKNAEFKQALSTLKKAEKGAKEFYDDENNTFFANLRILQTVANFTELTLKEAERAFRKSLKIYEDCYHGKAKHPNQAEAHFALGRLYEYHKKYREAKNCYLKSEEIYNLLLKNKSIDDLSSLYEHLALLGIKLKDEALTHRYLKKHIAQFGVENERAQKIILALDKAGLALPL